MNRVLEYDVVIIGGGPAGAVAAIAAAREGANTLLIERYGYLGGMLTTAGVGPQMTFHAGKTQVIRGIPDEIVRRLQKEDLSPGHMEDYIGYTDTITPFDAEGMKYILEKMVLESGAEILYHTVFTGCTVKDGKITSVRLYAKQGYFDVRAEVFLDCTADADLATAAGISSVYGRETDHLAQPMTMNVKVGNVDRKRLMDYVKSNQNDMLKTIPFDHLEKLPRTGMSGAYQLIREARENGTFHADRDMVLCFETNNFGEFILNMSRITGKSAIDSFSLTEAEIEGRRQAWEIVRFMKEYIPGFEECRLLSTGPQIGIRESRKIDGMYKLTGDDLMENRMFEDAIAMGGYPIDIHSPDSDGMKHRFMKKGSWYSIPYRCLVTEKISNLLVAGRCISVTHEACAAIRVTPIVMAIGQAAGTAAALSVRYPQEVNRMDTETLRKILKIRDVFLEEYISE